MNSHSANILRRQYKDLLKDPIDGFSAGINESNLYIWDATLIGPQDTLYEGGVFKVQITFPMDYPNNPPEFKFISNIYHPNIHTDGKVCISILHPPGEDKWGYESAAERWRPIHNIQSIVLSIISLLSDPNDESPANIDAAKIWRENKKLYKKNVYKCVRQSQEDF